MDKQTTLDILNREKEYEDKLVDLLLNYYANCVDDIHDIKDKDKIIINKYISIITSDSRRHSYMFNSLVQMVFENEENNY
jgi:hypothetical protein